MENSRISRDTMLATILETVSLRSTCTRAKVGALIVLDGRILSTGYAGSPSHLPHCLDVGCLPGIDSGCTRTIHAEQNVIAFAARHGIKVEGADLWCTYSPCLMCAKLIINSGIKRAYYVKRYRIVDGLDLLEEAGIEHRYIGLELLPSSSS
jgi:dCMP deaminase